MNIREVEAKSILTKQNKGFLTEGPYPFTHTLSWAVGCGFGHTYCGDYCYARTLPNWYYNRQADETWGDALVLKTNAPQLLDSKLSRSTDRTSSRIFMSSVTDPYQPLERKVRLTRQCLQVFAQYDDLDLLVIQTRSPLVQDDFDLIASIPYAWLSMTIETDRGELPYGPSDGFIQSRLETVAAAVNAGVRTQITVSPCLPYSEQFADKLIATGVGRVVVDTFVDGDGDQGKRTEQTPFADTADYEWRNDDPARKLYERLTQDVLDVGWSSAGFVGIPPRQHLTS